ncbi:MAG: peptidylprolyl isomerase [Chloroflexi bacterium]|nr:peptidylprolyl isomerase [Chloroflexota bacterium]
MSPKAKSRRQSSRMERNIQAVSIAAILIVVAGLVWMNLPRSVKSQNPACAVFESIPKADQYDTAPPISIDTTRDYFAAIAMEKGGSIKVELFPDLAPETVNSLVFLSCKGFYDGVTFHRVLEGFMAQTRDPTGQGSGGPGYQFNNEDSDLVFDKAGVVAMANAGRDTNGSQFFITFGPVESLNGNYTIFGQVVEGM